MTWIDVLADVRWLASDLEARAERELAREFDDADKLRRKAHALATGAGVMAAAERTRWESYNARQGELEAQIAAEWQQMELLEQCFAVEAALRTLQMLPADEENAAARAAAQAVIDAAPADVMALVTTRNRVPPPEVP